MVLYAPGGSVAVALGVCSSRIKVCAFIDNLVFESLSGNSFAGFFFVEVYVYLQWNQHPKVNMINPPIPVSYDLQVWLPGNVQVCAQQISVSCMTSSLSRNAFNL